MAVITISRQVAALGDEIATAVSQKLGYTFIDRKQIEQRIIDLGFPKNKLPKYDERKPGFIASLVKDRDEYLNYLQLAILEAASTDNCILIGRGAYIILDELPNRISLRFVSKDKVRMERLKNEFTWNDKQARARIDESDANRRGFHKSFFNLVNEDPQYFHMTLNTGLLSIDESVSLIENLVKSHVTQEKEAAGKKRMQELLTGQRLVNSLLFEHKLNVSFLRAVVEEKKVVLQGVSDSMAVAESAVAISKSILPDYEIESAISIVQDFKSYQ